MRAKVFVDSNIGLYSYSDKCCPEYVGRAVRALAPKARTARPTVNVLTPGTAVFEKTYLEKF